MLHHVDDVFSTWKPDSPVSRLRRGEIRARRRAARGGRGAGALPPGARRLGRLVRPLGPCPAASTPPASSRAGRSSARWTSCAASAAGGHDQRRRRHRRVRRARARPAVAHRHPRPAAPPTGLLTVVTLAATTAPWRPRAPTSAARTCSTRAAGEPAQGLLAGDRRRPRPGLRRRPGDGSAGLRRRGSGARRRAARLQRARRRRRRLGAHDAGVPGGRRGGGLTEIAAPAEVRCALRVRCGAPAEGALCGCAARSSAAVASVPQAAPVTCGPSPSSRAVGQPRQPSIRVASPGQAGSPCRYLVQSIKIWANWTRSPKAHPFSGGGTSPTRSGERRGPAGQAARITATVQPARVVADEPFYERHRREQPAAGETRSRRLDRGSPCRRGRTRPARPARRRPRPGRAARASLWSTTLRWCLAAAVACALAWLTYTRNGWIPLLSGADLGVHEFGHLVFFWSPRIWEQFAGSFMQVALPLAVCVYFWRRGDRAAAIVTLAWAAESLNNVSVYVHDATRMVLPLFNDDGSGLGPRLAQHPRRAGAARPHRPDHPAVRGVSVALLSRRARARPAGLTTRARLLAP